MDLGKVFYSILIGIIAGILAYVVLLLISVPPQPWAYLFGILAALAYYFSGSGFLRR